MPVPPTPAPAPAQLWPPQGPAVIPDETLKTLAQRMLVARVLDEEAVRWQRQGILPAFPPAFGQEAAQVGSASAIDKSRDMAFITYRDHGVVVALESDLTDYMGSHLALWNGGFADPNEARHTPLQAVVGSTGIQAMGWAYAQKLEGSGGAALAYFGDGASSQGDVHEAFNFASVMKAPVVFFVQNNQWSLSTPLHLQVAGGSVADRAAGYAMPSIKIDGDDVAEVYEATKLALDYARENGPVVIEAFTYRRGPHATSDDPSRYRTLEEERMLGPDPLDRVREAIRDSAWWEQASADAEASVARVREGMTSPRHIHGDDMFDFVFQEKTPQIAAQQEQWREETDRD